MIKSRRMRSVWHVGRKEKMRNACKICSDNLKGTVHFGDLFIHWEVILKLNLEKEVVTTWIVLNWLTIKSSGRLL
jgi:hypothetical protein